jgi:hypothetical protein
VVLHTTPALSANEAACAGDVAEYELHTSPTFAQVASQLWVLLEAR